MKSSSILYIFCALLLCSSVQAGPVNETYAFTGTWGLAVPESQFSSPSGIAVDMIAAWIAAVDAAMVQALPAEALAGLPVHKRIRRLLQFRLEALIGHEEALRRALAIMASPRHAARALRLGWESADAMWRLAGLAFASIAATSDDERPSIIA